MFIVRRSYKEHEVNSSQYWLKQKLPAEFDSLNMKQLTALRRMVQKAFNTGKKDAASRNA
jgi:hypothetical protein